MHTIRKTITNHPHSPFREKVVDVPGVRIYIGTALRLEECRLSFKEPLFFSAKDYGMKPAFENDFVVYVLMLPCVISFHFGVKV